VVAYFFLGHPVYIGRKKQEQQYNMFLNFQNEQV